MIPDITPDDYILKTRHNGKFFLTDLTGKIIKTLEVQDGNPDTLTGLSTGVYFLYCEKERTPVMKIMVRE